MRRARLFLAFAAAVTVTRMLAGCGGGGADTIVPGGTEALNGASRRWEANPPIHVGRGGARATSPIGYSPQNLWQAYGFSGSGGAKQTIAVVDAYGSPTIQNDLSVFCSQFGLGTPNQTFGFSVAYPQGTTSRTNAGWALETSLDVEWAHAIAPDANILLVVAKSNSLGNLLGAVDYAVSHGAKQVSMSWGGSEFSGETSYDSHFNKPGVTFTASAGDSGTGTLWPAASPYVTAIGGTTLTLTPSVSETAWSGSGGGLSSVESEPTYQSSSGWPLLATSSTGTRRGTPDVSYDANPSTGVAVYDSTSYSGQKGWFQVGGTSAGAPQWAALIALVNSGRTSPLSSANASLYALGHAGSSSYAADFRDVTSGSNGKPAGTGYDLVTGLGSPLASTLVSALIGQ